MRLALPMLLFALLAIWVGAERISPGTLRLGPFAAASHEQRPDTIPQRRPTDVTRHGVSGTGETDVTGAIRTALRRSPHLFFPAGVYPISDSIELPSGTSLSGDGAESLIVVTRPGISAFVARGTAGRPPASPSTGSVSAARAAPLATR